jgi:glucuronokinase
MADCGWSRRSIKRFAEYCQQQGIALPRRNFSLRYDSNIPRQVGLAGSSAIVTATMRALLAFYEVEIPKEILPG